jgi:glycosyltransferase involved in cell wall biosynthesis
LKLFVNGEYNRLTNFPANILYIDPGIQLGGSEISLVELVESLDTDLFNPIVVCPKPGPFSELCQRKNIKMVFLPLLPVAGGKPLEIARTFIPNLLAISRLIKTLDIRLVHSNYWRVAFYCGISAHLRHIPSVTHVRDYHESFRAWPKYWLLGQVSDRLITVSNAVNNSILSHVPSLASKTQTIYDGLPKPTTFSPEQVQRLRDEFGKGIFFPLIAAVGSFSPLKGQHVLLNALPKILNRFPETRLLLVGEPFSREQIPYKEEMVDLVHKNGLEGNVFFTGFRRDIPLIMTSIDILVHPPTKADAFPHVLLEASAHKALIVASNIGGIGEIVQDGVTGYLVQPNDPENLANTIIKALSSPDQANKMREAAYARINNDFSIKEHVSKVQKVYLHLLK